LLNIPYWVSWRTSCKFIAESIQKYLAWLMLSWTVQLASMEIKMEILYYQQAHHCEMHESSRDLKILKRNQSNQVYAELRLIPN